MVNDKEQLDKARERVIEAIAENINLFGVTNSIGRLYGLLYFHDEPLTLDEMKEELGMSKTSMSTSVRTLLDLKMVDKVWKKGVRKDLYTVEEDWYQSFVDLFTIKWRPAVNMNIGAIEKSIRELKQLANSDETRNEIKQIAMNDIKKLKATLEYYDWLNRLIDCFESGEIYQMIPVDGQATERRRRFGEF